MMKKESTKTLTAPKSIEAFSNANSKFQIHIRRIVIKFNLMLFFQFQNEKKGMHDFSEAKCQTQKKFSKAKQNHSIEFYHRDAKESMFLNYYFFCMRIVHNR